MTTQGAFVATTAVLNERSWNASTCRLHIMGSYGAIDTPTVRISLCATPKYDRAPPSGGGKGHSTGAHGPGGGGEDGEKGGPLAFYLALLDRHPLATKTITSGVISAISDIIAQAVAGASKVDWRRVFALFLVGFLLTAPLFHYLYEFLERRIPAHRGWRNTVVQLFIDQFVAAPMWLAAFFPLVLLIELGSLDLSFFTAITSQYRRDFLASVLLTWKIFIPTQALSFTLLPPSLRVLALNVVDLVYTAALSFLAHKPENQP